MAAKSSKKKDFQDQLDIENAYRNTADKPAKGNKAGKVLGGILLALLLIAGAVGGYLFFLDGVPVGKILDGVSVAGIDVGGMSKDEAASAIQNNFSPQTMTVTLVKHSVDLTADVSKVAVNAEAAAKLAYCYGRTGSYAQRKADQLKAATVGIVADISDCVTVDAAAVRSALETVAVHYQTELTQTTYEVTGERPSLEEPEDGATTPPANDQKLTIVKGTPKYTFTLDGIIQQVVEAYSLGKFQVEAECEITPPDPFDLDKVYEEICVQPIDAVMDEKTFEITEHSYGYEFDLDNAKSMFNSLFYGESMGVPFAKTEPQVKAQSLRDTLYKDVLSEYTAYTNSSWGRQTNLRLSCEAINGCVLLPGEVFSYNPALGERVPEKGWQMADGYVGNKTVSQYGGGICQASSCLYLCAMLADMEIVERTNHGFISAYMPYGMDATVSWGGPEFLFKNTSEFPIKIEAFAEGGNVTVRLLGTDTKDYYVKMDYIIHEVYSFKTVEEEHAPDNKYGYKDGQVIITPYTGYKISTYRCKYDKKTDELISRDFEVTSNYAARDKVVCKIVDPNAPVAPPAETTPPVESTPPVVGGTASEDG